VTDIRPLPHPNGRQPTIRHAGEAAGVSKSLVSLVLRGSPHVAEAKVQAVLQAVRELGYRPNAAVRSLTERRTHAIGVLMNDLRNPWFVECVDGLNSVFHANGLHMFLGDGGLDLRTDQRLLHAFTESRIDGLVLVGTMPESLALTDAVSRLPTVVAASRDAIPNVDLVANDDRLGAELASRHLIELGHRHIAHIAGLFGAVSSIRRRSYEATLREHGLEGHIRVEMCDLTEEGGYRAAIRLLSRQPRPTAIFVANDMACVGALSAASELGINVPNDLSLVGYDNIYLSRIRHLWLSTVDNASHEVGRRAARALLDRIDKPTHETREQLITPSLEIRGSTAPSGRQSAAALEIPR
jgi:DNA-binding LacI/PurR family transcriptional regulator